MSVRAVGVAAVLAVLGVAGGYAAGELLEDGPTEVGVVSPLPAASPSYPIDPPVEVLPDPGLPPMQPGLPLRPARFGPDGFSFEVPVPESWELTTVAAGEWRAYPPGFVPNSHYLRIRSVGSFDSLAGATAERLDDLGSAGGVEELEVEARTEDSFVVSYVFEQYRRVAFEQFFSLTGDETARVAVAVLGREVDRAGMADLLRQIGDGITSG